MQRRGRSNPSKGRLLTKLRVLEALAVRDMMRRYGRGNLGFLWVLLEPMILTVGVMLIWSVAKGEQEHGIEIIAFVLTGYMPLTLWRHMTNGGVFLLAEQLVRCSTTATFRCSTCSSGACCSNLPARPLH